MANSPQGQCPLRFCLEKETETNSLREGTRLENEVENLAPYLDAVTGKINKKEKPIQFDARNWQEGHIYCRYCKIRQ